MYTTRTKPWVRAPGARTAAPRIENCRTGATMNQRDKQALYDTYKERMHQHANNESASRWHTNTQRPMEKA